MKSRVLITCGPTREPIDPVRFVSNRATGTLGFEIAKAYAAKGHRVTLLHGPIDIPKLKGVRTVAFETARDLQHLLLKSLPSHDVLYMVAAVADYRPGKISESKIRRKQGGLTLRLVPNEDILKSLGPHKKDKVFVAFSVEPDRIYSNARMKLLSKNVDWIVSQKVSFKHRPFGSVPMDVTILNSSGEVKRVRGVSKKALAERLRREVTAYERALAGVRGNLLQYSAR